MAVRPILLLGDPLLWQPSAPVDGHQDVSALLADLRDTLLAFRRRYGTGKAISASQIGRLQRVIYVHEPGPPAFLLNPVLVPVGSATVEVWENCMSVPGLFVRTRRAASCRVTYVSEDWQELRRDAQGELSLVLQHECDHLEGILTLQRAVDEHSFYLGGPGSRPGRTGSTRAR